MWDLSARPGIKPTAPALETQSLNHWTTRKSLNVVLMILFLSIDKLTDLAMLHYSGSPKVNLTLGLFHEGYKTYCKKLGLLLIVANVTKKSGLPW